MLLPNLSTAYQAEGIHAVYYVSSSRFRAEKLEPAPGFEPGSGDYKSTVLPIELYRLTQQLNKLIYVLVENTCQKGCLHKTMTNLGEIVSIIIYNSELLHF